MILIKSILTEKSRRREKVKYYVRIDGGIIYNLLKVLRNGMKTEEAIRK